ncbi:MAG: hypothetical protein FWD75_06605 [Propionibacteriaceae bacterium]|nr:hypothetical protein [Propionibacteriaceae bacterium]
MTFGLDQCPACGASLKGGHVCLAGTGAPDVDDLGHGWFWEELDGYTPHPDDQAPLATPAGADEEPDIPVDDRPDQERTGTPTGDTPIHEDARRDLPVMSADTWEPDAAYTRLETLCGRTLRLDTRRTLKPPAVLDTDTVYQANNKFMRYARATFDTSITPEQVADTLGDTLTGHDALPVTAPTIERLFKAKPGTTWVVLEGDQKSGVKVIAVDGGFEKTGTYLLHGKRITVDNLSTRITTDFLRSDFTARHPEYDDEMLRQTKNLFRELGDKRYGGKKFAHLWVDEDVIDKELLICASQGWLSDDQVDGVSDWGKTAGDVHAHATDPAWVAEGINRLPVDSQRAEEDIRVANWGAFGKRFLYPTSVRNELTGTSYRARRARVLRDYRAYLADMCGEEQGRASMVEYVHEGTTTATVYQQKKNTSEKYLSAARESVFATTGDFSHVEVDDSVDLGDLAQVQHEYSRLRSFLPVTTAPVLRFRKTGRHNAVGVYHPHADNIAVDPRSPASFFHEYCHHIDFTAGDEPLSKRQPWIKDVRTRLAQAPDLPRNKPLEYWTTPTEVLARSGEMYLAWKGVSTSLSQSGEFLDTPAYRTLHDSKDQIIAFWDDVFTRHGGTVPTQALNAWDAHTGAD